MKKGLLSILAGALVVVGCQNYDDQFDNLESQISALASTVAGLSQVQSDLSSLAGTVSSLQSSVSSLGSTIDTAVADGLADIQADITAIEAAVADVASSEAVTALSDAVAASQEDLDELLANSSVFNGDITINSKSLLETYDSMGSSIAIVNGTVNITAKTDMDAEMLQRVVDQFLTVTGDFNYTSESSSIAEVTFTNLSGVQSMTLTQAGGYVFPALTSAKDITLKDDFESTVDIIDFRELTSVQNFYTDSTEDLIQFTKATELHLTKLGRYDSSSTKVFTLEVDEGGVIDISALDDVDTDGDQEDIYLSITGPDAITISNLTDGALTFTTVAAVTVNGFEGSITIGADVESLSADKVTSLTMSAAVDLETLDITGALDPDDSDDEQGPAISFSSHSNIETVDVDGTVASVTLEDNANLQTVTIAADVTGAVVIGSTSGNDDLTTVTLTGSKMTSLSVKQNGDLASLVVDTTWRADNADDDSTPTVDGSLTVDDNDSLTSLTVSSDNLETLTVTNNDDLNTIDFTGVAALGATGEPTVNIYNNDLTATKATDSSDGDTNAADGASGDLGTFTTESGMATLKEYLTAVDADADGTAYVFFDTVESYVNESDTETTDLTWNNTNGKTGTQSTAIKVLVKKANTAAGAKSEQKAKIAFLANSIAANDVLNITISSTDITAGSTSNIYSSITGNGSNYIKMSGNRDLDIAKIKDAAHVANASALSITLDAKKGGTATASLTFNVITSATTSNVLAGERYTTTTLGTPATGLISQLAGLGSGTTTITADTWWLGSDDYVTVTFGSNTVTATTLSGNTKNATALASAVQAAYVAKYGTAGWASASAIASISVSSGQVIFTSLTKDSSATGLDLSVSVTTGSSATTTGKSIEYTIGETLSTAESDNESLSTETIITLESDVAGLILDKVTALTASIFNTSAAASVMVNAAGTLTTTKLINGTDPKNGLRTANTEARADTRLPEGSVAAATSNGVDFNRISWLG